MSTVDVTTLESSSEKYKYVGCEYVRLHEKVQKKTSSVLALNEEAQSSPLQNRSLSWQMSLDCDMEVTDRALHDKEEGITKD